MNGNPYKPVSSGDKWQPKRDWINAVNNATQKARQGNSTPQGGNVNEGLILVGNDSGAEILQGQVLGVEDILWGPDDNLNEFLFNYALEGRTPIAADKGCFVVAWGPIAKNAIGECYIFGVCPCWVKMNSTSDGWAEVVATESYLSSGSSGSAQILYASETAPTGAPSGVVWALIRLPAGGVAGLTQCNVTNDGGSDGTDTTTPSYTYSVFAIGGVTPLATGKSPVWARSKGSYTAASHGTYYGSGSSLVLYQVDEVEATGECG